jgi:hypothetical protein
MAFFQVIEAIRGRLMFLFCDVACAYRPRWRESKALLRMSALAERLHGKKRQA